MTDRAQLFRAKQIPLLLLQPPADFLDAADHPVELFVEILERMRPFDSQGAHLLIELGLNGVDNGRLWFDQSPESHARYAPPATA